MFKFLIKPKPKIKIKKLIQDNELVIKSMDTEFKLEADLSKDVSMKASVKVDLNPQANLGLEDVKSAEVSFTKRF